MKRQTLSVNIDRKHNLTVYQIDKNHTEKRLSPATFEHRAVYTLNRMYYKAKRTVKDYWDLLSRFVFVSNSGGIILKLLCGFLIG